VTKQCVLLVAGLLILGLSTAACGSGEGPTSPTGPSAPVAPTPPPPPPPPPAPIFERTGVGNTVFDMPRTVTRVHISGAYEQHCENFIVRIGGKLVVNEILGACSIGSGIHYNGDHLVSGGVVEITDSNGVAWSIKELR
jgi:hypothetical protein